MKTKIILWFLVSLTSYSLYGQDSIPNLEIRPYKFKSKKNDERVKQILTLNERYINLRCYPLIAPEIQNTLKDFYGGEIDSSRIQNDYKVDSTIVCIEKSYCWNVNKDLPKINNIKLIKKLLKKQNNITEEEEKLLKYWEFYSYARKEKIEKFIHYQSFTNNLKYMQVEYEIKFDSAMNYKVDIKEIKTTANKPQ